VDENFKKQTNHEAIVPLQIIGKVWVKLLKFAANKNLLGKIACAWCCCTV